MEAARATERRVLRAHQQGERHDTEDPAVETHHEVEEPSRIAGGDQHQNTRHSGKDGDEAAGGGFLAKIGFRDTVLRVSPWETRAKMRRSPASSTRERTK